MRREKLKWLTHKSESTEARHRGGVACSSEEGSVMGWSEGATLFSFIEWSTSDGRNRLDKAKPFSKRLRRHRRRSEHWIRRIARHAPGLFAHWRLLHRAGAGQ